MTTRHRPSSVGGSDAPGHPVVAPPRRRGPVLLTVVAVAVTVTASGTVSGRGAEPAHPERLTMDGSVVAPEAWGDPRPLPRTVPAGGTGPAAAQPVSSRSAVAEPPAPPVQPSRPVAGGQVRLRRIGVITPTVGRDRTALPAVALEAYQAAERRLDTERPACRLDWPLLAAIGHVESDHGRFGGRTVDRDGRSWPAIIGIALDGTRGTAEIRDTDGGALDGDRLHDRAVGPMQFIPGTWRRVAVDGDGDGRRDPHDLHDAALSAGVYLCAGGEVHSPEGRSRAVFRYNRSPAYVSTVLELARRYAGGPVPVLPDGPAGVPVVAASPAPTADAPTALALPEVTAVPAASPSTGIPSPSPSSSPSPSPAETAFAGTPSPSASPTPGEACASPSPGPESSPAATASSEPTATPAPTELTPTASPTEPVELPGGEPSRQDGSPQPQDGSPQPQDGSPQPQDGSPQPSDAVPAATCLATA